MDRNLRAKRFIIGSIALYAVLLHIFAAAAFPVAVFNSLGEIVCAQNAAAPASPANDLHHHHAACCILGCAACGFAFVATASGSIAFAAPAVSVWIVAKTRETTPRSPLKFYFAARAPPQNA